MSTTWIWHNGQFMQDAPVLTAHDRMRLGECVFNTVLCIDGQLIHGATHFEKLLKNADVFFKAWNKPNVKTLTDAAEELLKKNGFIQGRYALNCMISQSGSGQGLRTPEKPDMQIVMRAIPIAREFPPVRAIIATSVRRNEGSPLSQIKCGNYGENILALAEATERGANEAIMLNNKGFVACATSANIFMIQDGGLFTPPLSDGAQNGLTRKLLIERIGATEKSITPEDLQNSQGVYITNSVKGATPVTELNGKPLPAPAITIDPDFHL
jgi:branched-subunit amino acid aminotransferase/4-amino-4-deoxychorismate lyase